MPRKWLPTWMMTALWDDLLFFVKGQSVHSYLADTSPGRISVYQMGCVPEPGDLFKFNLERMLLTSSSSIRREIKSGWVHNSDGTLQDGLMMKVFFRLSEHMHEANETSLVLRMQTLFSTLKGAECYTKTLLMVLALDAGRD